MKKGYKPRIRPSEHVISKKFGKDNKGAIPPNIINGLNERQCKIGDPVLVPVNLIAAANTSSNDPYLRVCRVHNIKPHPARFPPDLPQFFINLCTEKGDIVLDPFAGSNMTGYIAEKLGRRWIAIESKEEYLIGARFRFEYDTKSIAALERARKLRESRQRRLDKLGS